MRFVPALAVLVLCAALFAGFAGVPSLDEREARDAGVAREMAEARELLVPLWAGSPRFEKPSPAYALEFLALGTGEHTAARVRTFRAILAVLLVAVVGSIAAEHFGGRAGWLAAGVFASGLATTLAVWTDSAQLFGALAAWIALSGFADAVFAARPGRDARLLVSWVALGGAAVMCGPLAALWPVGAVALYAALLRDRALVRRIRPLPGVAIAVAIALPWYGAMLERYGAAFVRECLAFPYGADARGAWYAPPLLALSLLVAGMLPWSALLPAALSHAATWWRAPRALAPSGAHVPGSRETREEHAAHFFVACLVAAFAPLVVVPHAPMPAILPAFAAAALACGRMLDHALESPRRLAPALTRAALMLGLAGASAAALLSMLAREIAVAAPALRLAAVVLFATAWLPFLANWLGRTRAAIALFALPVAATAPIATLRVLPAMQDYFSAGIVADAMNGGSPRTAVLVVLDAVPPTLRNALERNLVTTASPDAAWAYPAPDGYAYVAFRALRERAIATAAPGPIEILLRSPTLVLARVPVAR